MLQHDRFGHMVHEALLARVRALLDARGARLAALRTRKQAEAYVARVRRAVRRSFGPFPARTPLNTRITGTAAGDGYTIEKLLYESRPANLVSANLYVPEMCRNGKKHPVVLMVCGHSGNGKQYANYQAMCLALARKGFLTLILDPIEQGERGQFGHLPAKDNPGLCYAHNIMGNQQALIGDFFGLWRAWDAIRGLDYLLSRPEADPARVGVTGNSGGGTLSTYVAALDPRVTMAAPSCFICSYGANLQNELPSDAEQNPPGILAMGLDQADLLLTYAPRPTLILGQREDFFDVRYTRKAADEMARVHRLLGSRGTASCFIGPTEHGFSPENREAVVAFFMKYAGLKGDAQEAPFTARPDAELWATPNGSTVNAGSRRIQEFTRDTAAALRRSRGKPSAETVARRAARLLGVRIARSAPHYRILSASDGERDGFKIYSQFAVETEPDYLAVVCTFSPGGSGAHVPAGPAIVYVGHESGPDDVRHLREVGALTREPTSFFTVDPRGIGEVRAKTCGDDAFLAPYGSDFLYASTGEMLGESLLGRRVHDVLRSLDFLRADGVTDITLCGRGIGSITVAFAALLDPARPKAWLMDYLPAYEDLVKADLARWPLSAMLRGCLREFDLPDVYRALGARLTLGRPWDPQLTEIDTRGTA